MITYPTLLQPTHSESVRLPDGASVAINKATPRFALWRGALPADTYGGKEVLHWRRQPAFAELVVLWTLQRAGWEGVWIDSYRRRYRTGYWGVEPVKLPIARQRLLEALRKRTGRYGGAWDVFCWRGNRVLFAEVKSPRDHMRPGQRAFLAAALEAEIPIDSFLIVQWSAS